MSALHFTACSFVSMSLYCQLFHGITPVLLFIFSGSHYDVTLASHCNAACHCTTDVFMPVCDQNKTLYFSPCHAGCMSRAQDGVVSDRSLDGVVGDEFRWCCR